MTAENEALLRNLLEGEVSRLHSAARHPLHPNHELTTTTHSTICPRCAPALLALLLAAPTHAHASIFHGETLDAIANGISWVVIVIAPIIGIAVFWLVHILPEKIAREEKASADPRDPVPVPALACLRRTALADRLALGLHEAGAAQDGLRHRRR